MLPLLPLTRFRPKHVKSKTKQKPSSRKRRGSEREGASRRPGFGAGELTSQEVTATCGGGTAGCGTAGGAEPRDHRAGKVVTAQGTDRRRCSGAGCPTKTQTQTRCASPGGRTHAASPFPAPAPEAALGPQAAAPGWRGGGVARGDGRGRRAPPSSRSPEPAPGSAAPRPEPAEPRGRLPGSTELLTVARRAEKPPVHPASIARHLLPPPRAKSERRGSRRGSEGKGLAPSSLRGGYVAILDPRDKKIHARENWWAVLPVTRPLSDSSI